MPRIFKTLASITVWILFIIGCLILLAQIPIICLGIRGGSWQYLALSIASLFLSVVAMKLIKTLD